MGTQEEQNKALVRGEIENVINNHITDRFADYIAENGIDHDAPPNMPPGPAGTKMFFEMFFQGSSNSKNTISHLIAEGDRVTTIATIAGTHDGNLFGMPATGKKFSVGLVETVRIADGKYAERWGGIDTVAMMMQLGAVKDPGEKARVEQFTAMVHRYIDGVNNDDPAALREVFAVDFNDHNSAQVTGLPPGVEGVVTAHHMLNQSFSDLTFTIDEILVEGDQVAIRVHAQGKHTGDFYGFPPTGKADQLDGAPDPAGEGRDVRRGLERVRPGRHPAADGRRAIVRPAAGSRFSKPTRPSSAACTTEENKGNVDIVDELMSPDFVMHGDALNPYQKGLEPIKQGARMTQEAFPDLVVDIEDIVAAGDKVMVRLRWTERTPGRSWGSRRPTRR